MMIKAFLCNVHSLRHVLVISFLVSLVWPSAGTLKLFFSAGREFPEFLVSVFSFSSVESPVFLRLFLMNNLQIQAKQ